ncbi:MAG: type II toxin-antitoxin system VapC family toxin [Deltaproteobacteria bacterium]|nr:type II toxin-antitoxin system VapC family toxin [Deltaproteobacteria bacterium]
MTGSTSRRAVHVAYPLTVVLDTHAWLWLMAGEPTLRQEAVAVAREAAAAGTLHVSAISAWEVAMLAARGRIVLPQDPLDWVRTSVERAGVVVAELSPDVLVASARLPGDLHGEPADRFIVATARRLGAVLVTRDRALLGYAAQGHVRVIEA